MKFFQVFVISSGTDSNARSRHFFHILQTLVSVSSSSFDVDYVNCACHAKTM